MSPNAPLGLPCLCYKAFSKFLIHYLMALNIKPILRVFFVIYLLTTCMLLKCMLIAVLRLNWKNKLL